MSNTRFLICSYLTIISGFCFEIRAYFHNHRPFYDERCDVIWFLWVAVSGWIVRDIRVMHYEVVRVLRTGGGSGFDVDMTRAAT